MEINASQLRKPMKPTKEQIKEAIDRLSGECSTLEIPHLPLIFDLSVIISALKSAQFDSERLDIIEDIFSISDDGSPTWKEMKTNATDRGWRYAADVLLKRDAARIAEGKP
jgi:hypothetical protein